MFVMVYIISLFLALMIPVSLVMEELTIGNFAVPLIESLLL